MVQSFMIYKSNSSMMNAPMADTSPMNAVTIITVGVIPFKPMTSSCSSSSSAGRENTAMPTSGPIRLKKNILLTAQFFIGLA